MIVAVTRVLNVMLYVSLRTVPANLAAASDMIHAQCAFAAVQAYAPEEQWQQLEIVPMVSKVF
jgi:hypothetical protein